MNKKIIIIVLFIFTFAFNTHAYIDPGTGSYIVQVVIAAILGAAVTLKVFWTKIGQFLKRIFGRKKNQSEQ